MKFSQEFTGVIAGEVYPRVFAPGEECPPELLEAAKSVGAVSSCMAKILQPADTVVAPHAKRTPKAKAAK